MISLLHEMVEVQAELEDILKKDMCEALQTASKFGKMEIRSRITFSKHMERFVDFIHSMIS